MPIHHTFISTKNDSADASKIQPSHWNADHDTTDFFIDDETLTGTIDGSNDIFTLANAPNPVSSLHLYKNGTLLRNNVGYTIVGNTITFNFDYIPQVGDIVWAEYRK